MRRRPRLGDLVLLCATAVLAASAYATLHHAARARSDGLAAFTRDAARRPGVVSHPVFRRAYRVVAVCAPHQPSAGAPIDFRLCGILTNNGGYVYVRRFYRCRLGTRCAPPQRLPSKVAS